MQTITVGKPTTIHSGQVRLSRDQAQTRRHALRLVGKPTKDGGLPDSGVYEVVAPIHFKAGEQIVASGEITKGGDVVDREAEARATRTAVEKAVAAACAEEQEKCAEALARAKAELAEEFQAQLAAAVAEAEARVRAELTPAG